MKVMYASSAKNKTNYCRNLNIKGLSDNKKFSKIKD